MEIAQGLQAKYKLCKDCENDVNQNVPCLKCSPIAMLKPKLNLVGSVPEGTRAGGLQEIDVMMELKGLESSFFLKVTSATKLHLSTKGKTYFGKFKLNINCEPHLTVLQEDCHAKCVYIQGCFLFMPHVFFLFSDQLAFKAGIAYSLYDDDSGILHYGQLLELLLTATAKAFKELDQEGKLPANIRIGMHNEDFDPL